MPTPLDYERFGLSQQRFERQGDQYADTMDFRRMQDERNFGYRQERDSANDAWRQAQAAQQERLALLRMLPRGMRPQQMGLGTVHGPQQAAMDYQSALDRQDAHNYAAVPSWQAERDRSDFAASTGADLRNYAAQQQMNQMMRLQQRQSAIEQPLNDALVAQRDADARKAGFENMSRLGKIYGAPVGDLYAGYDQKSGYSTLPGDYVSDSAGGFTQKPGRKIAITPGHYAAMRAYMAGQQPEGPEAEAATPASPYAGRGLYGGVNRLAQGLGQAGMIPPPSPEMAGLRQRITQLAGERRIMPQAIESARAKLKAMGTFTEQDIISALEAEDTAFLSRNLEAQRQFVNQANADRAAAFAEESRPRLGIRGWTPMTFP